jgi:hypothetical protein
MVFVTKLCELLITFHNAFRLCLGQDPPANVRPLKIELKPDAKRKRIPARKYAPPQAQFLAAKMAYMERLGLVKKNLPRGGQAPLSSCRRLDRRSSASPSTYDTPTRKPNTSPGKCRTWRTSWRR